MCDLSQPPVFSLCLKSLVWVIYNVAVFIVLIMFWLWCSCITFLAQDETLVFSSLNRIEDPEYTFNTVFQDQEYKVLKAFVLLQSCWNVYACTSVIRGKERLKNVVLFVYHAYLLFLFFTLHTNRCMWYSGHMWMSFCKPWWSILRYIKV